MIDFLIIMNFYFSLYIQFNLFYVHIISISSLKCYKIILNYNLKEVKFPLSLNKLYSLIWLHYLTIYQFFSLNNYYIMYVHPILLTQQLLIALMVNNKMDYKF
jgi:hypothetical protein